MYTGNISSNLDTDDLMSVYPCVYREHCNDVDQLTGQVGLSLCIQGTYPKYINGRETARFIPVYTGNI